MTEEGHHFVTNSDDFNPHSCGRNDVLTSVAGLPEVSISILIPAGGMTSKSKVNDLTKAISILIPAGGMTFQLMCNLVTDSHFNPHSCGRNDQNAEPSATFSPHFNPHSCGRNDRARPRKNKPK